MKNCTGCAYAEWYVTEKGRLHPSGDGKCIFPYKLPPLPASMRWSYVYLSPTPIGGDINRRRDMEDHCIYYARKT